MRHLDAANCYRHRMFRGLCVRVVLSWSRCRLRQVRLGQRDHVIHDRDAYWRHLKLSQSASQWDKRGLRLNGVRFYIILSIKHDN